MLPVLATCSLLPLLLNVFHFMTIPQFVHVHFGCFYLLAIMIKAAMNIYAQICVWTYVSFLLGNYLRVKLMGCMVNICSTF